MKIKADKIELTDMTKSGTISAKLKEKLKTHKIEDTKDNKLSKDTTLIIAKDKEHEKILEQKSNVLDALDILELPRKKLEKLQMNNKKLYLEKKYEKNTKEIIEQCNGKYKKIGNCNVLNEQSISDLKDIKEKLIAYKVNINDIQFLIAKDGHVVISDPIELTIGKVPEKSCIEMIDFLIEVSKENITKK